jgi:BirA family transcriptional regulator, biotin operon repressor / biotin---[acetyl-CoA-carboxylase] ligase
MTSPEDLSPYLDPLGLGAWRYLPVVGSTNDIAREWAVAGAPDWALVVADAQTAGRGRGERRWLTEPGGALAFSLVLRPTPAEAGCFPRFTALAALGLIRALGGLGLAAQVKWPNDVLLDGRKAAGVLVEVDWQAGQAAAVVVGLGVNVSPASVPPAHTLRYPATAVEVSLGAGVDRWALLAGTLASMRDYRAILTEDALVDAWNAHLALRGEWVRFRVEGGTTSEVRVLGVQPDGQLVLERKDGTLMQVLSGEILMDG